MWDGASGAMLLGLDGMEGVAKSLACHKTDNGWRVACGSGRSVVHVWTITGALAGLR